MNKDIHWRDAKKEKPPTDIEILGKCKGNSGNEYVSVIKVSSDLLTIYLPNIFTM